MARVLDPTPAAPRPPTTPVAAHEPEDPRRVVVYLVDDDDRRAIIQHAAELAMPLSALLRRCTATAVRATTRAGFTARHLVDGAAAALARDFPLTFGPEHPKRGRRTAESVMRWLLARFAVLPLPAPTSGSEETGPVWTVRLDDGSDLTIDRREGRVCLGGGLSFSAREWLAVAAAGVAAAAGTPPTAVGDEKQPGVGNDQPR